MQQTIIGFFKDRNDAVRAAERLKTQGFDDSDIDVASPDDTTGAYDRTTTSGTMGETSSSQYTGTDRSSSQDLNETRVEQRRDDDDSFGESIGRFFRNLFDNKEEAERFTSVGRTSSIVSVYAENSEQAERARDILDECGAFDVDERGSQYGSDNSLSDTREYTDREAGNPTDSDRRNTISADGTEQSLPVIEENLNIGKREVETGGVRLRSRIFERPVEEKLRLRQERVRVERVPADRPATEADFQTFREGEIEVTETSEQPVVSKEARVVEEVRLTKDVEQHDETVRDTVRKTDVEIENLNDETIKSRKRKRN